MTSIIITIFIIAAIAAAIFFFKKSAKTDQPDLSSRQPVVTDPTDQAQQQLLDCNLRLRKQGVQGIVLEKYEQLIDRLLGIIPDINQQYPDGELTWVINRIAAEYLPEKSVTPYLALDIGQRESADTIRSVTEGIEAMIREVDEVVELLATRKSSDFDSKAKFLKQRFNF